MVYCILVRVRGPCITWRNRIPSLSACATSVRYRVLEPHRLRFVAIRFPSRSAWRRGTLPSSAKTVAASRGFLVSERPSWTLLTFDRGLLVRYPAFLAPPLALVLTFLFFFFLTTLTPWTRPLPRSG